MTARHRTAMPLSTMPKENDNKQPKTAFRFAGFSSPQYTQVPDQLFDELMPRLSGAELKVLLYICRRTFGFKKTSDNISLNQMLNGIRRKDGSALDGGVGLSKPTLLRALKRLKQRHIIIAERRRDDVNGDMATNYRLHLQTPPGQEMSHGEDQKPTTPPGPEVDHQQETDTQQTETAAVPSGKTPQEALRAFGIDAPTIKRLVRSHPPARILEKVDYVRFMQEAGTVANPRGWLLKAIDEDYGPPTGYRSAAERAAEREAVAARHSQRVETRAAVDQLRQTNQAAALARTREEEERALAVPTDHYGTGADEQALWQAIQDELADQVTGNALSLVARTHLLSTADDTVVLGAANEFAADFIQRRLGPVIGELLAKHGCHSERVVILTLKELLADNELTVEDVAV